MANEENGAMPKTPTSLERLVATEQRLVGHQQALQLLDRELSSLKQVSTVFSKGLDALAELMTAHVDVLGEDHKAKLTAQVEANREKVRQTKEASARAMVKAKLDAGELAVADAVEGDSLVVFTEFDQSGTEIGVHYTPVVLTELNPEIVSKFVGQKAGFEADVSGGKLKVLEVYKAVAAPTTVEANA